MPQPASSAGPFDIVVIDDDPLCNKLIHGYLTQRGHNVLTFVSPTAGLEHLLTAPSVHAVLSDLHMPNLSGDQLFNTLANALGPQAPPLIMISASDDEEAIGRALDAGARHFIRKPISFGELGAVVHRVARSSTHQFPTHPQQRIGHYVIEREIGRGGMGVVFLARDPQRRPVAVKLLAIDQGEDLQRFQREFAILKQLQHPSIVRMLRAGVHERSPYFAMDFVRGHNLKHQALRLGALPAPRVARLGATLAGALDYLHNHGVIHRDIKPENVVLDSEGRPILIDFGLARRSTDTSLTQTGWIVGTPHYLAPEAMFEDRLSPAMDVHALGLTLAEVLLGAHPLSHLPLKTPFSYAEHLLKHGPPDLRAKLRTCPPPLAKLLQDTFQPNPDDRPTAADLARNLEALAGSP